MRIVCIALVLLTALPLFAEDWQAFMAAGARPVMLAEPDAAPARDKNLKAALFMSAAVPGAGQVYAQSYWKAAAFLAVEVAAWSLYSVYTGKGKDIENEFHHYADTHWSESEYFRWIAQQSGIAYDPLNVEPLREWEKAHFSHGLHRDKDQQYYEMIGKYHQFNYGWDDFRRDHPITITHSEMTADYIVSSNRYFYESRRNASNEAFKTATTGVTVVLFNHIVSALDAAWTTNVYNRRLHAALQVEPIRYADRPQPALTLRLNW